MEGKILKGCPRKIWEDTVAENAARAILRARGWKSITKQQRRVLGREIDQDSTWGCSAIRHINKKKT